MRSTRSIRTASSSPCPGRNLATSIRASGRHLLCATSFTLHWIVCPKIARPALRNVVFDYDQHTSAEDLVLVPQSPSGSTSTPHDPHPMAPGEWNGNNNDWAFPI